jgi:hypothetical protein
MDEMLGKTAIFSRFLPLFERQISFKTRVFLKKPCKRGDILDK